MAGIILVGASGVGKTTLARYAAGAYALELIESKNSATYKRFGVTPEEAAANPPLHHAVQREILAVTVKELQTASAWSHGWVTDRGFDVLCYSGLMLSGFFADSGFYTLTEIARRPDVLVLHVRPHPKVLAAARADDGGRRAHWLTDEYVYRCDGAITYHLEQNDIPHATVEGADMRGRVRTIDRFVRGFPGLVPKPNRVMLDALDAAADRVVPDPAVLDACRRAGVDPAKPAKVTARTTWTGPDAGRVKLDVKPLPVTLTVRNLTRDEKRAEYRRRYREKKKAEKLGK